MICQNLQHDMECPGTGSHCHSAEAVPRRDVKTAPVTLAEALQVPEVRALVEAGEDARAALLSAKEFILRKYGSTNPAREDAIVKLDAALRPFAEDGE